MCTRDLPGRRSLLTPLLCSLLLAACSDSYRQPLDTAGDDDSGSTLVPAFSVAGGSAFHFLPPLAVGGAPVAGFDDSLLDQLEVVICRLAGDHCAGAEQRFTAQGHGSARLRVESGHYIVNWQTPRVTGATERHRVEVRRADAPLGAVVVWLGRNGAALRDAPAGAAAAVGGQTIPVKFHVGTQPGGEDPVAEDPVVGPEGGVITALDGDVVLDVPPGALTEPVAIGVRRVPNEDEFALPGTIELTPHGTTFAVPVVLTLRYDQSAVPAGSHLVLFRIAHDSDEAVPVLPVTHAAGAHTVSAQIHGFSRWFLRHYGCAVTINAAPAHLSLAPGSAADVDVTAFAGRSFLTVRSLDASVAAAAETWLQTPGTVRVTALTDGSTDIELADMDECGARTVVPVTVQQPVHAIEIAPVVATIIAGQTVTLTATLKDPAGNTLSRPIDWTTNAADIVAIEGGGTAITARGMAVGEATVTASSEGVSAQALVTVTPVPVATVEVAPADASIQVGHTQAFTVTLRDAAGNELSGRAVAWSTDDDDTATIDADGSASGLRPGSVTITAESEGISGSATLHVTPGPVHSISVEPAEATVQAGQSQAFTATLRDAFGNVLAGAPVDWSSDDSAVADVDAEGVAFGKAAGTASITATSDGVTGTATLHVVPVPVSSVVVEPAMVTLSVGDARTFTATPYDAAGNPLGGRAVAWLSSDETVASIDDGGRVTAHAAGTATITALIDGVSGSALMDVTANPSAIGRIPLPGNMRLAPVPMATIAMASDGTAYGIVCGFEDLEGGGTLRRIVVARSLDGQLWEQRSIVDGRCINHAAAVVDGTGALHVIIMGGVIRSHDGGASWSPLEAVPNLALAVTASGDRYTIGGGGLSGPFRIYRSLGGSPFAEVGTIPRMSDTNLIEMPQLVVTGNGSVVAAWRQNSCGYCSVFQSRSTNAGVTWSTPQRLSNLRADRPSMAADGADRVMVTWLYRENDIHQNKLGWNASTNGGQSWIAGVNGAVDTEGERYEYGAVPNAVAAGAANEFFSLSFFSLSGSAYIDVRRTTVPGMWHSVAYIPGGPALAIAASPVRWCVLRIDIATHCSP
jgi:uncharacterized protein YjdB